MKDYIDFKTIDDSVYYSIIDTWYSAEELVAFNVSLYGDTYVLTVATYDEIEVAPFLEIYEGKTIKELYERSCEEPVLGYASDNVANAKGVFSPVQLLVILGGKNE